MSKHDNNHEPCENCCGEHDHHHHDHDHHHHGEEEMDIIHLTLDDDTTLECGVLGLFEVEDKEYIALLPLDEDGPEDEALLYEYKDLGDEEFDLALIEDEDEFNSVVDAFYALFSDGEIEFEEDEEED